LVEKVAQRAKAVAAAVYSILVVLSATTLPDPWNKYVALAVLVLGPIVVHQVDNKDPKPVE